jgi:pimeloyl-ACP methyl ester carboxylesterase
MLRVRPLPRQVLFIAPWQSEIVFAATVAALDVAMEPRPELAFKDMEFAQFVDPPRWADWTLDTEVVAIELLRQRAKTHELDLVGFSGGGAVALAYAVAHPEALASLTLIEPPWIGNDVWSEEEAAFREAYDRLPDESSDDFWEAVTGILNGPRTPVPPRPLMEGDDLKNAFLGVWRGYQQAPLDRSRLREIGSPVYLPVGAGSAPRMRAQAECLASCFPNARVETYEGASHFDLPFVGAEQLAKGLNRLWNESLQR